MAKKVFNAVLTVDSINNLKRELLDYKNQILQNKIETLVQELAQLGIQVAEQCINDSPLGKYVTIRIESNDTQYLKERRSVVLSIKSVSQKLLYPNLTLYSFSLTLKINIGYILSSTLFVERSLRRGSLTLTFLCFWC